MQARRHPKGFTLLELSIVILVLSIMLGGIMTAVTQNVRRSKMAEYNMKIKAIETALLDFRKRYSRLPCPADLTYAIDNSRFSLEAANLGTCTGGLPAANFSDGVQTVGGALPVHALGLPDEYVLDPWGGRFVYFVDKRATANSAFVTYKISSPSADDGWPPSNGSMRIRDAAGNIRIGDNTCTADCRAAMVVILSHGPNGHGAYQISGTRRFAGVTNANEWDNCNCNATVATAVDDIFIMAPQSITGGAGSVISAFDDLVKYYTRADFLSGTELLTESQNIVK